MTQTGASPPLIAALQKDHSLLMLADPYKAGFAEWDVMKNREGWLPTKRCTSAN